jgi:hypothetical protein
MKTLIKFILILVLSVPVSQTFSQSDSRINRLAQEVGMTVRVALYDSPDITTEREIFCGEDLVTHFINKRHFIAHSSYFVLDLEVIDRKIGKYNSWLAVDENKNYFFITPFGVDNGRGGKGYGVFVQPVDKKLNKLYDRPVITMCSVNICQ